MTIRIENNGQDIVSTNYKELVGKKFRRRKDGHQETRLVVDVTLGGDVLYSCGPRMCWHGLAAYQEWKDWQNEATEIPS